MMMVHCSSGMAQINTDRMMIIGRNAIYYSDYALSIQYFNLVVASKPYLSEPYYYRAIAKFYLEDFVGSEIDCTKSIDLNPFNSSVFELRGLSRINQKKYAEAAEDYEQMASMEFDNKTALHNLLLCYLEIDSLTNADSVANKIVNRWPTYSDGHTMMADVRLKQGDTIAAEMCVDKALDADKFNVSALSMKAAMLMHREAYADAETFLNEAIRLKPLDTRNIINRALSRYSQDNYRGAMSDYNLAIQIDPNNFIAHYNRGLLLAAVGEDNKAIEDFNYILQIDPDDIMTLFNRARLLDQIGDYEGAIRDYTTVIKEFPKFLYGYQLRAEAKRKMGDIKGAMKDEEHILRENVAHHYGYSTPTSRMANKTRKKSQIDPNDYQQLVEEDEEETPEFADNYRGKIQNKTTEAKLLPVIVYQEEGDKRLQVTDNRLQGKANSQQPTANGHQPLDDYFDQSDQHYLQSFKIEAYGLTAAQLTEFIEATKLCKQAEEIVYASEKPSTGQPANKTLSLEPGTLSNMDVSAPIYQQASERFSKLISTAPRFAEAHYNYAYCLAMLGKDQEALEALNQAISQSPTLAPAYYNRGIIHLRLGHTKEAISDFSRSGELGIISSYSMIKQAQRKKK